MKKDEVIDEAIQERGMRGNSREKWKNSRGAERAA
jgi:hypothetical protein